MAPALVAEDVRKRFGDVVALDGVGVAVDEGETVALLGPSGCGKTTLLRVVAGLERPDTGTVVAGGRVLTGPDVFVPGEHRGLGMVFQDWALFPHLTVGGNVAYGLPRHERKGPKVGEALALVGLEELADRMPSTLSGGQQQRVALARMLVRRPGIVLLDEPFSNLDAALRTQLRSEVSHLLARLGVATVFVTHDQEEACALGDRLVVLRDGRVVQEGTPSDVYARPATPWVAGFLGDANLVPGMADGREASTPMGRVPLAGDAHGEVAVLVRPEWVAVEAGGAGEIVEHEYQGPSTTYLVRLGEGPVVRVREWGPPRLRAGERVTVRYHGEPTSCWPR